MQKIESKKSKLENLYILNIGWQNGQRKVKKGHLHLKQELKTCKWPKYLSAERIGRFGSKNLVDLAKVW